MHYWLSAAAVMTDQQDPKTACLGASRISCFYHVTLILSVWSFKVILVADRQALGRPHIDQSILPVDKGREGEVTGWDEMMRYEVSNVGCTSRQVIMY